MSSAAKWVTHAHSEPQKPKRAMFGEGIPEAQAAIAKLMNAGTRERIAKAERIADKQTASGLNENEFVAVAGVPGGTHQGAVPTLEAHGVMVGIKNGIMVIQRRYVPTATGLLSQIAGVRS